MGKGISRRNKKKTVGRRTKRVRFQHFPLYRQLGGGSPEYDLLTNLPGGNGATNFAQWLDASDPNGNGVLPVDGASISTWVDKSGNGRHMLKNESRGGTVSFIQSLTTTTPPLNMPAMDFRTTADADFNSKTSFLVKNTVSVYMVMVVGDYNSPKPNQITGSFFSHNAYYDAARGFTLYRGRVAQNAITLRSANGYADLRSDVNNVTTNVPGLGPVYQGKGAVVQCKNIPVIFSFRMDKSAIKLRQYFMGTSNTRTGYQNTWGTESCTTNNK